MRLRKLRHVMCTSEHLIWIGTEKNNTFFVDKLTHRLPKRLNYAGFLYQRLQRPHFVDSCISLNYLYCLSRKSFQMYRVFQLMYLLYFPYVFPIVKLLHHQNQYVLYVYHKPASFIHSLLVPLYDTVWLRHHLQIRHLKSIFINKHQGYIQDKKNRYCEQL